MITPNPYLWAIVVSVAFFIGCGLVAQVRARRARRRRQERAGGRVRQPGDPRSKRRRKGRV